MPREEVPIALEGSTAVITGASSGLGRSLALELARRKAQLVLAARNQEALEEVAAQAEELGGRVRVQSTDVTEERQCRALVEAAVESFGGIDWLVLTAGLSMWARFEEVPESTVFRRLMEVNYLGALYCVRAAIPRLQERRGTIVAVSSLQAVLGVPNHTGYSASKHALKGFLDALDMEQEGRVGILNVMPGWIRGTGLRAGAFRVREAPSKPSRHGRLSVDVDDCAVRIVRAMEKGRRELFLPAILRLVPWLRLLFPGLLRSLVRRVVRSEQD